MAQHKSAYSSALPVLSADQRAGCIRSACLLLPHHSAFAVHLLHRLKRVRSIP